MVSLAALVARGSSTSGLGTGALSPDDAEDDMTLRALASANPAVTTTARTNTVRKLRNVTI